MGATRVKGPRSKRLGLGRGPSGVRLDAASVGGKRSTVLPQPGAAICRALMSRAPAPPSPQLLGGDDRHGEEHDHRDQATSGAIKPTPVIMAIAAIGITVWTGMSPVEKAAVAAHAPTDQADGSGPRARVTPTTSRRRPRWLPRMPGSDHSSLVLRCLAA